MIACSSTQSRYDSMGSCILSVLALHSSRVGPRRSKSERAFGKLEQFGQLELQELEERYKSIKASRQA